MIAKNRANSSNYNARCYGITEQLSEEDILDLFEVEKVCKICGSPEDLTVDHVIPLAGYGPNTRVNLQILCKPCNSKKNSKMPDGSRAFRQKRFSLNRFQSISVRLNKETLRMLEELAEKDERSMSDVMRRLLREEWKKMRRK